jgi:hypothetical protein
MRSGACGSGLKRGSLDCMRRRSLCYRRLHDAARGPRRPQRAPSAASSQTCRSTQPGAPPRQAQLRAELQARFAGGLSPPDTRKMRTAALCGMLAVVVVSGHASPRRTRNALYVRGLLAPELTVVPFQSPSSNTLPRLRTARIPDSPHDASGRQMCSPSGSHRSRPVAPCDQILQICVSHVKRSPAASRDRRHNKKQRRASSRCPPAP